MLDKGVDQVDEGSNYWPSHCLLIWELPDSSGENFFYLLGISAYLVLWDDEAWWLQDSMGFTCIVLPVKCETDSIPESE